VGSKICSEKILEFLTGNVCQCRLSCTVVLHALSLVVSVSATDCLKDRQCHCSWLIAWKTYRWNVSTGTTDRQTAQLRPQFWTPPSFNRCTPPRRAASSIRISCWATCCCSSVIARIAIGANFKIYLLHQLCSNWVQFVLQYTGDKDAKNDELEFWNSNSVIFENFLKLSKTRRSVPLRPIWTIMVVAKLDQSMVLVTKFHQNWLMLKGRSAGQRHTQRQTRLKIRALQVCNRANNHCIQPAVIAVPINSVTAVSTDWPLCLSCSNLLQRRPCSCVSSWHQTQSWAVVSSRSHGSLCSPSETSSAYMRRSSLSPAINVTHYPPSVLINSLLRQTRIQRDGRPAEHRWRPLFNAAKFGWRPLLECRAVTLPRYETHWNLLRCPKLRKRSHPLGGWAKFTILWGHVEGHIAA